MKPLTSRPHTVWIEDDLWAALSNKAVERGSTVKDYLNDLLRAAMTITLGGKQEPPAAAAVGTKPKSPPPSEPAAAERETVAHLDAHGRQIRSGLVDRHGPDSKLVADFDRNHRPSNG